jgi:small subunit ribosomal protein S20
MPNHASARKRVRSNEAKHARNRYQWTACKIAIKKLKKTKEKEQAEVLFRGIAGILDKVAGRYVIHQNKAARVKSQLSHYVKNL